VQGSLQFIRQPITHTHTDKEEERRERQERKGDEKERKKPAAHGLQLIKLGASDLLSLSVLLLILSLFFVSPPTLTIPLFFSLSLS